MRLSVFKQPLKNADPETFNVLTDNGYSADRTHVFIDYGMIAFADPGSFQVLEFPYSKDKNDVYCGMIPLGLTQDERSEFVVTNQDKLMASTRSAILLSHFIEMNPDYAWINTLPTDRVIVGEWGTGETKTKKFIGFREIKEKGK